MMMTLAIWAFRVSVYLFIDPHDIQLFFNPRRSRGGTPTGDWHTCSYIFSAHIVKILDPSHSRSGSTGHFKWPHLRKSLNACHSYTDWPIALKLSTIDIRHSIYKMYVSQWEIIQRRLFRTKTIQNTLKQRVAGRLDTLNPKIATSDPSSYPEVISVHDKSPAVSRQ